MANLNFIQANKLTRITQDLNHALDNLDALLESLPCGSNAAAQIGKYRTQLADMLTGGDIVGNIGGLNALQAKYQAPHDRA